MTAELLLREFDRLIAKPEHVTALRQSIFDLALTGRLVKAIDSDGDAVELIAAARAARDDSGDRTRRRPGRSSLATVTGHPLPTLPESWRWARLDEIAEIVGGITKDDKNQGLPGLSEVPYLRVANVQRGYLDLAKITMINVPPETASYLQLVPGDILFNEGGDRDKLGRGWIWEGQIERCIHQNHVFRARLYAPIIDPRIVSWHGNSFGQKWFIQGGKQTTNLASVNKTTLSAFPVPIPPLAQQHRIVAKVDELMAMCDELESAQLQRERRRKQLSAASLARFTAEVDAPGRVVEKDVTFFLSHSSRIVTQPSHVANVRQAIVDLAYTGRLVPSTNSYENVRLGDVSTLQNGFAFKSEWYARDGVRLLRNANVGPGSIDWSDSVRLPNHRFHEFGRFALKAGNIVVSLDRPFISTGTKVARLRPGDVPALLLQRVGRFLTDGSRLTDDYLLGWLRSPRFVDQVTPGRSNGVPHISSKAVESTHIYLPTLQEQAVIVARVNELMAVCDELERSLQALEAGRTRALEAILHGALEKAGASLPVLLEVAG